MFSIAVSVGTRLNDWKTKPMRSRRSMVRRLSPSRADVDVADEDLPEVRRSSPARQCISVDLPEPDGPMMAVNRPAAEPDGDAVEGPHRRLAPAVHLDRVDRLCGHDPRFGTTAGLDSGWASPPRAQSPAFRVVGAHRLANEKVQAEPRRCAGRARSRPTRCRPRTRWDRP